MSVRSTTSSSGSSLRIMRRFQLRLSLLAVAVAACYLDDDVCTSEGVYGISVRVQDSVTGAWIGQGSTLIVQDGTYNESVTHIVDGLWPDDFSLDAANKRRGLYAVTVHHEGYAGWMRTSVLVRDGERGHVRPVALVARLQPEASS